ncbi:MAG: hypothetical protein R3F24_09105 [Gammaproteobacteria bacterium]
MSRLNWIALGLVGMLVVACDNKGPVEQAGEEIDEAVDTMKSGSESTANKVDDAIDDVRDGAKDAVDELKK